jgi:hypothetical protein
MSAARPLLASLVLVVFASGPVSAACEGDCDGDGAVRINELVTAVNIALGSLPISACPSDMCAGGGIICIDDLMRAVLNALHGCPVEIPPLLSSDPADGASDVPGTTWIRLTFAGPVSRSALTHFTLWCDGAPTDATVSAPSPEVVVINPAPVLSCCCRVHWPAAELSFGIAAGSTAPTVFYDHTDPRRTSPFPDDAWTVADSSTATGLKVAVPLPAGPDDLQAIFNGLLPETNKLDGFSPIAHFVVELSDAPDVSTLPLTPTASLDPLATIGLFDLTPDSPTYGRRVPFLLTPRTDTSVEQVVAHSLLVFPSIPLTSGGRYGFVVTRRALVDPARPFDKSEFFRAALEAPEGELVEAAVRVQQLAGDVIDALHAVAVPPIDRGDVALALRITVRTTDDIPNDMLAVKAQVLAAPPPAYDVTAVEAQPQDSPLAAIVRGTWQAPEWRDPKHYLARDAEGRPLQTGTKAVPFTLALPKAALDGPVPIAMYQHGNPGSSENEVPSAARRSLAAAGFAVIGFTDVLNRELSPGITDPGQAIIAQIAPVLGGIIIDSKVPDFWVETRSEMLAFLRFFDGLGSLDVLPVGAPDGMPELDVEAPRVYLGISEGGNNGQGFLPYAPEIRAGAIVVGGARLGEVLIHQGADLFLNALGAIYRSLTPADIWVGLSLFQTIFDNQDAHNHVRFLYRDRLEVAGTLRKPSVLVLEGLNDTLVPNHATDSMAWSMGPIPHLQPVQRAVPFLEVVSGPISANIDAETTAGFYQYVPTGVSGIPSTPGCEEQPEGHYCAQSAPASFHQRAVFFQGALDGVPMIIDPLAEPVAAPFASAGDPIVW